MILLSGDVDENGYVYPSFSFNINHNYSVGDQIVVYSVGGNYDGEYVVNQVLTSTQIQLKKIKTLEMSLDDFDGSLNVSRLVKKSQAYIKRVSDSEYNFIFSISENLYPGMYTIVIKTKLGSVDETLEINFEVLNDVYTSSSKIVSTKIENNVATVYTDEEHGINAGDYIYISGVSADYNGSYYVSSISSSKSISFPLYLEDQELTNLNVYGSLKLLNLSGVSPVLSGPNQPTKISYKPKYDSLQPFSTNSVLLIRTR